MTRCAAKLAVLDVDGTLIPGSLGLDLARHLALLGAAIELAELEQVLVSYARGDVSHEVTNANAYRIFARGLAGLRVDEVREAAGEVWRTASGLVFDYARPLISRLTAAGFEVLLISGSPADVVRLAADDLGAAGWHGASLEVEDGRYLPKVVSAPGLPGEKLRALRSLAGVGYGGEIGDGDGSGGNDGDGGSGSASTSTSTSTSDGDGGGGRVRIGGGGIGAGSPVLSLAVGNSPSDVDLLDRAARPFAFEPDRALRRIADRRGWPIIDRGDALDRVTSPEPA